MALEILGLDGLQQSVYRALLDDPRVDVAALAARLGVGEDEARAAISRLRELSLVRERGDERVYVPVDPDVALDAMLSLEQAELSRRERHLLRARAELSRLVRDSGVPDEAVRQVRRLDDVDQVREVLYDLAARCYQETLSVVTGVVAPDQLAASLDHDLSMIRRGVRVRILHTRAQAAIPSMREHMTLLQKNGAVVRVADTLPHRLLVFDRAIAFLPIAPGRVGMGALVVREPAIIANLLTLFESLWSGAVDLDRLENGAPGASEFDRSVLLLMSSGVKDETAARQLSVSDRTYRRHVADILVRLGASSRFQAGVEAVRRGWL